jgi:hypothetical protein
LNKHNIKKLDFELLLKLKWKGKRAGRGPSCCTGTLLFITNSLCIVENVNCALATKVFSLIGHVQGILKNSLDFNIQFWFFKKSLKFWPQGQHSLVWINNISLTKRQHCVSWWNTKGISMQIQKGKELVVWLNWWSTSLACARSWVQNPVLTAKRKDI